MFTEWVRLALRGVGANKLRALLTTLGIIIGVAAVIALVSVAQGAARDVSARLETMGSHLIIISPRRGTGAELTVEDAREIQERVPTIEFAVPSLTFSATVKWHGVSYETSVEGVGPGFPKVRNFSPERGRFLAEREVETRALVAVLGQTVVREVFDAQDPLGQTVYIGGRPFLVVGVMEAKGTTMGRDSDDIVFIPVTTAQRLRGTNRVSTIYANARSGEEARLAVEHLSAIYSRRFPREDAVMITSQDELLSAIGETARTFTVMLGAIAGISLVVGGIGIMNIMLVSVAERTREIGVRKAVGAKKRDILAQFLIESVLLSASGGVVGIGLGTATSRLVSRAAGWSTLVSPEAVALAFLFAAGVGLFFGVYPAQKAASLDPIEALRYQ